MPVHRLARHLIPLALLVGGVACSDASGPGLLNDPGVRRVASCRGPATDLPESARIGLRTTPGALRTTDDEWAALAREVPGGFAGIFVDGGRPVLMLTDPGRAAAAKAALAPHLPGFPIGAARVREARWDFAQLVDWSRYLAQSATLRQGGGILSDDRDEVENRIVLGVIDAAAQDRVAAALAALGVPCDLVLLRIEEPVTVDGGPGGG